MAERSRALYRAKTSSQPGQFALTHTRGAGCPRGGGEGRNAQSNPMNAKTSLFIFLTCLCVVVTTQAVKVDTPEQAENESSNILTGTVTAIYSRIVRDASYEWNHSVAAVRIESIQKGQGLKPGDLIFVRYISSNRWIGKGGIPPGPGGHNNVPVEGERRKVCLNKNADGGFDVYYVSGFKVADDRKP